MSLSVKGAKLRLKTEAEILTLVRSREVAPFFLARFSGRTSTERGKCDMQENKTEANQTVNPAELLKKPYLNEKEAALVTGRSVFTLRNERCMRCGLPYLKVARRSIRYSTKDILKFMESRRIAFDEAEVA